MKLLVSDYDRTFYTDKINLKLNIKAIEKFRLLGNKFMIATGRDFKSIKRETNNYHIPIDYLSCNDGSSIYSNKKIIKEEPIDEDIVKFMYDLQMMYDEINKIEVTISSNNHLLECYFTLNDLSRFEDIKFIIEKTFPFVILKVFKMFNKTYFSIKKRDISKSSSISLISSIIDVDNKDIFIIGDHLNDLEMIRDYNGFKMVLGRRELNAVSLGSYFSVHKLVDDIINDKVKRR